MITDGQRERKAEGKEGEGGGKQNMVSGPHRVPLKNKSVFSA